MEESKALRKLMDAAELVSMLEELTSPGIVERLSNSSLSGLRLTLRNIRESIISGHDILAADYVERARMGVMTPAPANKSLSENMNPPSTDPMKTQMVRRDLRSSIEKFVDRG
jgi:hypothetical protein